MSIKIVDGQLRINGKLWLPRAAAGWVLAFLAKRGAGKTYCAAVLAEEMIKAGIPVVVVDGMGIWWGLRVAKDGQGDGLPVVVFGGEHADLPLIVERAKDMAAAIVQTNINCVIDVSELSKGKALEFVGSFLSELYRLNRADRHIFIEEADLWAPQRTMSPQEAICLGAVDNFVRRGGNRNLGCTLITQRAAVLNKNVLTQADALVVLRTLAPQDKKAIQAWVSEQTDSSGDAKWYDSLKGLENGEAWVWRPEDPAIFEKVHFRLRETFHATREFIKTAQAAQIRLMPVDEFVAKFRKTFDASDVPEAATFGPRSPQAERGRVKEMEDALADANHTVEKQREIIVEKNNRIDELNRKMARLEGFEIWLRQLKGLLDGTVGSTITGSDAPPIGENATEDHTVRGNIGLWTENKNVPAYARTFLQVFKDSPIGAKFTRAQLAINARMSPTSSYVGKGISYLKRNGLIAEGKAGIGLVGE